MKRFIFSILTAASAVVLCAAADSWRSAKPAAAYSCYCGGPCGAYCQCPNRDCRGRMRSEAVADPWRAAKSAAEDPWRGAVAKNGCDSCWCPCKDDTCTCGVYCSCPVCSGMGPSKNPTLRWVSQGGAEWALFDGTQQVGYLKMKADKGKLIPVYRPYDSKADKWGKPCKPPIALPQPEPLPPKAQPARRAEAPVYYYSAPAGRC